jgi:hypothetical protein
LKLGVIWAQPMMVLVGICAPSRDACARHVLLLLGEHRVLVRVMHSLAYDAWSETAVVVGSTIILFTATYMT